jgi:uncharacterized DUF497 family protein
VFEWDPEKAARNEATHGVSFAEAATIFGDPNALDGADIAHSWQELRFLRIGMSIKKRVLIVAYTLRRTGDAEKVRIISARRASRKETQAYASSN